MHMIHPLLFAGILEMKKYIKVPVKVIWILLTSQYFQSEQPAVAVRVPAVLPVAPRLVLCPALAAQATAFHRLTMSAPAVVTPAASI